MKKNTKTKKRNRDIRETIKKLYEYADDFPQTSLMFGLPLGQGKYYLCSELSSLPKNVTIDFAWNSRKDKVNNVFNASCHEAYQNVLMFSSHIPLCRTEKEYKDVDWMPDALNCFNVKDTYNEIVELGTWESTNKVKKFRYKRNNKKCLFHDCKYLFSLPEVNSISCYNWGFIIYSRLNLCLIAVVDKGANINMINILSEKYDSFDRGGIFDYETEVKYKSCSAIINHKTFDISNLDINNCIHRWDDDQLTRENTEKSFDYIIEHNISMKPEERILPVGEFDKDILI